MAPKMLPSQTLKLRNIDKIGIYREMVVRGRIEGDLQKCIKALIYRHLMYTFEIKNVKI